jgi:hypothetical protein
VIGGDGGNDLVENRRLDEDRADNFSLMVRLWLKFETTELCNPKKEVRVPST